VADLLEQIDMKTVPLHGKNGLGRVTLVSDEDYELVASYRWLVKKNKNDIFYAYFHCRDAEGKDRQQFMHALITGWEIADHIDHDGLNNQRSNLRDGSGGGNQRNTRKTRAATTSAYKGVYWNSEKRKWHARIYIDGHKADLGRYASEVRAARAYDAAASGAWGEFAYLNFPPGTPTVPEEGPPETDARNAAKTHCKRGHEFTPENIRWVACRSGRPGRSCRTCERAAKRQRDRDRGAKPRGSGNGYVADRNRQIA
jgi:hypothetical protein